MVQLAANLSMMFTEVPFLDRFERAAKAGFTAVEYLFPYEFPAPDIAARLRAHGQSQVLFNAPPGNWAAGERGLAAVPGREAEFREGLSRALDYATALGCPQVHVMAGILPPGVAHLTAASVYAANLDWAARAAAKAGIALLIEPINHRDMPGYFLNTTRQARDIIAAVGEGAIRLQFDIYHCQITEGDVTRRMAELLPLIAHMQIADVPERHEPGTGEIGWEYVFRRIDAVGYKGFVGCEYRPAAATEAGLAWRKRYGV
ncbi:MAG: 2-oxo-tetronate isomerase [Acetobacteraceae bacterium]